MVSATIGGTDEMTRKLSALAASYPHRVEAGLFRRANIVMTISKRDFVPVDFGVLRNSGEVHMPERNGTQISVTLSYGGAASAYALAVHEHPSLHSPPSWRGATVTFSPPGHGPKYLERPLLAAAATMAHDLVSDLSLEVVR